MTTIGLRSCFECGSILDDGRAVIDSGKLRLDRVLRAATWGGKRVKLTPQEIDMVELLVTREGKIVRGDSFFILVLDEDRSDALLKTRICRIRSAFRAVDPAFDQIQTHRGQGYRWLAPDQERT